MFPFRMSLDCIGFPLKTIANPQLFIEFPLQFNGHLWFSMNFHCKSVIWALGMLVPHLSYEFWINFRKKTFWLPFAHKKGYRFTLKWVEVLLPFFWIVFIWGTNIYEYQVLATTLGIFLSSQTEKTHKKKGLFGLFPPQNLIFHDQKLKKNWL